MLRFPRVQVEGRAVAYEPMSSTFDWTKIREELQELGESMNCDVEFQEDTKRLGKLRGAESGEIWEM